MGRFSRFMLLVATALLFAGTLPARALEPPGNPPGARVGDPAPGFDLPTADGKRVSLASLRGKTVVVNVWATWCPPCRQETPGLLAAHKALAGKDVVFLGVDSTESGALVRAFSVAKNIGWTQALDPDKTFSQAYDVRYFPTTYVIDPQGVLRVRYVDSITPAILASFVTDAKSGRNGQIASALQTKLDALLAPAQYPLAGDEATVVASVEKIRKAIDEAEKHADESEASSGNPVDLPRTQAEENVLRLAAIAALAPIATTDSRKVALALLKGESSWYDGDYPAALSAFQTAAALDPKDADALDGVSRAARRLKEYDLMLSADEALAALDPADAVAWASLAIDSGTAGNFQRARIAFDRALAIQGEKVAKDPKPAAIRRLAWVHLYYGRMEAKAKDAVRARRQFALVTQTTLRLPKTDPRYDIYLEQAQEESVALDLGDGPRTVTALSLAPWTGPELPGSVPSTAKYRLVVTGPSAAVVALHAADLPKGWIASFCTDRICAPLRVTTTLPASGVKVIEFQVVPPDAKALAHVPSVRVIASDGKSTTAIRTLALRR